MITYRRNTRMAVIAAAIGIVGMLSASGSIVNADQPVKRTPTTNNSLSDPNVEPVRPGDQTIVAPGGGSASTSCYICKKCGDNVGNDPNCQAACDACSITAAQPSGGAD